MKTASVYKNKTNKRNTVTQCHSRSSQHHDVHGYKCWRRQRLRDRQYTLRTTTMSQNSFSLSRLGSFHYLLTPQHRQPLWAPLLHLFSLTKRSFLPDACVTVVTSSSVVLLCRASCCLSIALSPHSAQLVNSTNLDESQSTQEWLFVWLNVENW